MYVNFINFEPRCFVNVNSLMMMMLHDLNMSQ